MMPQGLIWRTFQDSLYTYILSSFNHRFTKSLGDIGSLKDCPLQELNLSGGFNFQTGKLITMQFTGEYYGIKISSGCCLRASTNMLGTFVQAFSLSFARNLEAPTRFTNMPHPLPCTQRTTLKPFTLACPTI